MPSRMRDLFFPGGRMPAARARMVLRTASSPWSSGPWANAADPFLDAAVSGAFALCTMDEAYRGKPARPAANSAESFKVFLREIPFF
jgi:hypothetical protein